MKKLLLSLATCSLLVSVLAQTNRIDRKVDSVLRLMTLEEKIGQLNQYNGDWEATGPITKAGDKQEQIIAGKVGSMLNVTGVEHTRVLQELAMRSRLRIPLLFGQDVIHGYRTIFPIPLAEAASWDLEAIERSARIAAIEASAQGIHWTFAPMVDVARDPRWGRVMEGAGEDTYLGTLIAVAQVKGFQGKGLGDTSSIMACAKHFAAYGAAVGGRDYNSVDMSLRQLHETYLPPFKAAVDAGVATLMNSFNDINGIPASANKYILRDVLKGQWNFKGFVVSDWGSIGEMIKHGYVANNKEAAERSIIAGTDMDMESRSYIGHLANLVKQGRVKVAAIDDAVKRILRKKFELGLFDDPYRYSNKAREEREWNNEEHLNASLDIARKSIVLLKNEHGLLPLKKELGAIALIGPLVKSYKDHLGFWSYDWKDDSLRVPTLYDAVRSKLKAGAVINYAQGCSITGMSREGFAEAMDAARKSEIVVMYVGERRDQSGEAKSRSDIQLPGVQEELIKQIAELGKPMVVLIGAGRPLVFNWTSQHIPAIVYTWWLGTKGANAIADVIFGDFNPCGKLPMSFPRNAGQVPIYYNHYNTGRPASSDSDRNYVSAYIDLNNDPQYPFGYGLSYSKFEYGELKLSSRNLKANETLSIEIPVTNKSDRNGTEVIQLYIRDLVGSVVRPVKELKAFKRISFNAGETKTISFRLRTDDLKFYNNELKYDWEPGEFQVMVGGNSAEVRKENIIWGRGK